MSNSHYMYDVKFYVLTKTQSTASGTNAIEENLPGPGRNLGRLYDWLGRRFENMYGKILFRAGYGPTNIARKIKTIRNMKWGEIEYFAVELRDSDLRKLCRHCRKLVRYSRSGVLETQLRAVDAIIEFAIYDPLLNSILNHYVDGNSNEVFAWDISFSNSDHLLSSCRKALVSLSPFAIALYDAARQYGVRARTAAMTVSFLRESFLPTMIRYLRNSNTAFIAVRHLSSLQRTRPSSSSLNIYFETLCLFQQLGILLIGIAFRYPENIEWPFFDDFILGNLYSGHVLLRHIGRILFSFPHRIPKVVRLLGKIIASSCAETRCAFGSLQSTIPLHMDPTSMTWRAVAVCSLLEYQTGDARLESHLRFISSLTEETQHFLSSHNLPFSNAGASSVAMFHEMRIKILLTLDGHWLTCRQLHKPSSEQGRLHLLGTNTSMASLLEFLDTRGRVVDVLFRLIPQGMSHHMHQEYNRCPPFYPRRRRSIDFTDAARSYRKSSISVESAASSVRKGAWTL